MRHATGIIISEKDQIGPWDQNLKDAMSKTALLRQLQVPQAQLKPLKIC